MNATDAQRFREATQLFREATTKCELLQALHELQELANHMSSPWDKAEIQTHEVIVLVDVDEITAARQRVDELAKNVRSLISQPVDGYEYDLKISLPLEVRYLEVRVAFAERRAHEALKLLDELVSRYPQQLSIPEFHEIYHQLGTLRGFILGDLGRWEEAEPQLESASPPEKWKAPHAYYMGRCYYELGRYNRAKQKLTEAIERGLTSDLEGQVHYMLGLIEYSLTDIRAAKRQFELCARDADESSIEMPKLWSWLERTSAALGHFDEAERYHKLMIDSLPKKPN
jgi:tetratricopeptide (TPR) repeat protein